MGSGNGEMSRRLAMFARLSVGLRWLPDILLRRACTGTLLFTFPRIRIYSSNGAQCVVRARIISELFARIAEYRYAE